MIHALPGLGANHRMYPAPWDALPDFRAHDWVRHQGEETLPEVADTLCRTCRVNHGDILIGSSLGGMVACELTKRRRIPILFLIGSALRKEEVSSILTTLHPLAPFAPWDWLKMSAGTIPHELAQMFKEAETSFLRSMCRAVFRWEGGVGPGTRVVRIHGTRDLVIPPPPEVDLLIEGGHVLALTHASKCAEFVATEIKNSSPL
jgi:pimeloyl-ACP methyl ester carboxylesterase